MSNGNNLQVRADARTSGEFAYSKKENADYAKLVVAAYIIGVNFVPVVGPVISIGLGTLDAMGYFDSYYYSFNYYNQPRK